MPNNRMPQDRMSHNYRQHNHRMSRALLIVLVAGLGAVGLGGVGRLFLRAAVAAGDPVPASEVRRLSPAVVPDPPMPAGTAPEVRRTLAAASDEDFLRLIVVLQSSDLPLQTEPPLATDPLVQRAAGVRAHQERYAAAKLPLLPALAAARAAGTLREERDLWLVNAVGLEVTAPVARSLAASPAVAEVHLDHLVPYVEPAGDFAEEAAVAVLDEPPWGLEAIEAPRVWHTFAVSGTGATVAVMDTGVDWQHPDLSGGYRGNLGKGVFDHAGGWYDAVNGGTYPYDDHGHGTHVAGTAVGTSVGVAPGASWMGVKVLNSDGYGYDSWILSGFQWLVAPNGDPTLAPDVVNASWSSSDTRSTVFLAAVEALKTAGILPVFAAGNAGPQPGTVGSPASNPGVLAVGASDPDRDIAPFSGRGPSPWDEVKPLIVAPGVNVISSGPGGIYLVKSGTSMASPHVAGLGALMRGVSPTVSVPMMMQVLTQTARPLTTTLPNNDSGWGEVSAYQAIVALIRPAILTGTVTGAGASPLPVSGATITAWPDTAVPGVDPGIRAVTDAAGRYTLPLSPGRYVVRAEAFAYSPQSVSRVDVVAGPPQELNFALTALPAGVVEGGLTIAGSGGVPTTTVSVRAAGTPVVTSTTDGSYRLTLPEGSYTLAVRGLGYRAITATVTIVANTTVRQNFSLEPAPTLLLVDEGAWYYGSQTDYWSASLDALRYVYDDVRIKDVWSDVPVSTTLARYDIVLWSSPLGSPGLVGAGSVLSTYLASGGRLLLSGQDVAYLDGGGSLWGAPRSYLAGQMGVQYVADTSQTPSVAGAGPFVGLDVTLGGGTGADNQASPDVVATREGALASLPWVYEGGGGAGVAAELCVPYRSLFLSFGFEGIADEADRHAVLQRSIDWLMTDPLEAGLMVTPLTAPTLIGLPGERVTHVLKVTHIGVAGDTETVRLAASGKTWPTQLSTMSFELAPCTSALVTVTVTIPTSAAVNASDTAIIAVTSDRVPVPVSQPITTKTPAPVLLVDDDRWYPMEEAYREALDAAGVVYDLWDTRSGSGGTVAATSPPTRTLTHYPIVVWFTGYDWYAPVEDEEVSRLLAYLDQGGKLLLSSQDFVYHHQDDALTRRLGVMLADWADEASAAVGAPDHPAGQVWDVQHLVFPFPNWSHTVEPLPSATPFVRGQLGQPIGVATGSPGGPETQTLFYSFPLEALPPTARSLALANGVGWLSPIGGSTWRVSSRTPVTGTSVGFELEVRNTGSQAMTVDAVHYVPETFEIQPGTLPADAVYDAASRALTWRGLVSPAAPVRLPWDARWLGGSSDQGLTVTLSLPGWGLAFVREAAFYGAGLDLAAGDWQSGWERPVRTTESLSLTYRIHNDSANGPAEVSLAFWLMTGLGPMTATTPLTHGTSLGGWQGVIEPFGVQDVVVPVTGAVWDRPVRIDALLTTATGDRWEDALWFGFEPWRSYLPIIR